MSTPKYAVYSLGERIRKAREDMGWLQADLADGVKKKRATIAGWENNKHRPSALELDFTITIEALAPGASCWRPTSVGINSSSFRVEVDLKWHDESGARSDRHIVELL